MKTWYWSFAIHIGLWAVLAVSALYVERIALTPVVALLVATGLPVILVGDIYNPNPPGLLPVTIIYLASWILLLVAWPIAGFHRWWYRRRSTALLAYAHFVILLIGFFGTMAVGSINFRFRL